MDARFEDARSAMDARFEDARSAMDARFDEARTSSDRRFEDSLAAMNAMTAAADKRLKTVQWAMSIGFVMLATLISVFGVIV